MREGAETLVLRQDGHTLTLTDCPPERNRLNGGIREVLKRSKLTADVSGTWDDLRAWAEELGLFVDPLDDQPEPPPRYENPVPRLLGLRQ